MPVTCAVIVIGAFVARGFSQSGEPNTSHNKEASAPAPDTSTAGSAGFVRSAEVGGPPEQQAHTPAEAPQELSYPDPNTIPYRTRKSALVHLLSVPAKVWRLAWTPLGATVRWMEHSRIPAKMFSLFYLNDERTAAVFPLISLGGSLGTAAGLTFSHNNLFGRRKKLSASFLYNTSSNNTAQVAYQDSSLLGSRFYLDFLGLYLKDSDENLFISPLVDPTNLNDSSIGANNSTEDDDVDYATEQGSLVTRFGYALTKEIGLGLQSSFTRADVGAAEGEPDDRIPPNLLGLGETSLFSIGGTLMLNFTRGVPRRVAGSSLRLSYSYNRELAGDRFEYNRFTIEAAQFLPIPFLPLNRRLAIRGLFEKMDRIGEKQIPFYELSRLGDASNLRGFDQNRFRGRGLLLFNFEYRYPVWDTWDAVIFLDEGQVYDDLNDIAVDQFHTAVGTGLRFMSSSGFLMRIEIARSSEEYRALFQVIPNF